MATTLDNWTMTRDEETGNYTLTCLNDNFDTQEKKIQVDCGNKNMTGDLIIDVKAKKGNISNSGIYANSPVMTSSSQVTASINKTSGYGDKIRIYLTPSDGYKNIYPSDIISEEGWITRSSNFDNTFPLYSSFNGGGSVYCYFKHTSGATRSLIINTGNDKNKDFIIVNHSPSGGSTAYSTYIEYTNINSSTINKISYPFSSSDRGGGIFFKESVGWCYRQDFESSSVVIGSGNLSYLALNSNGGNFKYEIVEFYLGQTTL